MTSINDNYGKKMSSARGTELFFNSFRMSMSAIRIWFLVSTFVSVFVFSLILYFVITSSEKTAIACSIKSLVNFKIEPLKCFDGTGFFWKIKWIGCISIFVFLLSFCSCWKFLRKKGREVLDDKFIRGATLSDSHDIKSKINGAGMAGDFSIGNVPLLKDRETEHLIIVGATGSGKSVVIKDLLDKVRAKKQRAIIYDVSGEYVSSYFNPQHDVILNPLDERSPAWSLWEEAPRGPAMDGIAASLVPDHRGDDSFWANSARTLFSGIANQLIARNERSNERLFYYAAIAPLWELHAILKGTPAGALMDPASEKTASSIRATLANYLRIWPYLRETKEGKGFSIRKFIADENSHGSLFITSRADQHDFLKPILSCWLSLCINSILSLPENHQRRIWFFLDELASLHRIKISDFLERSRKYGGAAVLGIQATSQLQSIYGREDATSLMQNCKTGLFLQVADADTAKSVSAMCGTQEIWETGENQSFGRERHSDGASLARRRVVRPIVLDAEFLRLQKLEGYLRLPDDWPITKVQLQYKNRAKKAEDFIARA
jgi:type IV conjugative transfer system coupling protein TraD